MKNKWMIFVATLGLLTGCSSGDGQSVQASYIGLDAAKTTALSQSGISQEKAVFTTQELESKDGTAYYEIDFTADSVKYHYAIDAMTGAVIEHESEQQNTQAVQDAPPTDVRTQAVQQPSQQSAQQTSQQPVQTPQQPVQTPQPKSDGTTITEARAKEIALEHAGVKSNDVTFVLAKLDWDDGKQVYDVEFYAGSAEYDYEIDANTGTILSYDYDAENYTPPANGGQSKNSYVSEASVKQTVLAKVPGANNSHVKLHLDNDDGKMRYEGKIIYNNMEYEFEVDAYSGAILEWDAESVSD